jgi:O-antigen/teichoic acid export membrane protein
MNSIFISYRESKYVFIKETVLFNFIKIICIPFLIVFGVAGILLSWGIALFISLIFSLLILIHKFYYKPSPSLKVNRIRPMFSFAVGNYITGILGSLPTFLLPVVLINILTASDTAHFYIAWMIGNILFTLPGNICMSLFAEGSQNSQGFRSNIKKSINFILLITIPAIIILWLFGVNILSIFGDTYSTEGADLLRILAISTIPLMGVSIFITIKRVEKRTKEMICVQGIIAILTLGITYFLSPTYGIISAGIGWILALCIALLFIACLGLYKRIKVRGETDEDTPY